MVCLVPGSAQSPQVALVTNSGPKCSLLPLPVQTRPGHSAPSHHVTHPSHISDILSLMSLTCYGPRSNTENSSDIQCQWWSWWSFPPHLQHPRYVFSEWDKRPSVASLILSAETISHYSSGSLQASNSGLGLVTRLLLVSAQRYEDRFPTT